MNLPFSELKLISRLSLRQIQKLKAAKAQLSKNM